MEHVDNEQVSQGEQTFHDNQMESRKGVVKMDRRKTVTIL